MGAFLYQLPDCTVVVHPKKRTRENVGEEKEGPSSHSHTDGFHMGFGKSTSESTISSLLLL